MIKMIIDLTFQLALVLGESNAITTVYLVIMDLDVVKDAIVVICRHAIPNKDVLSNSRVNKLGIV